MKEKKDTNLYTRKVQARLLEMAKKCAAILDKHNIPYMVTFGTLLGAIRHKGFIPWDDDFDFYLFENTYEEAIIYLRNELPDTIFVEDEKSEPLYFHSWAHLKDTRSIVKYNKYIQDDAYFHKGISIDLYKTHKIKKADLIMYLNNENRKYLIRRKEKNLISDIEFQKRISDLEKKEAMGKDVIQDGEQEVFDLLPIYNCNYIEVKDVFPLKKYIFEDTFFWGPCNAERILKAIYGEYMVLPPLEMRHGHYSSVIFL